MGKKIFAALEPEVITQYPLWTRDGPAAILAAILETSPSSRSSHGFLVVSQGKCIKERAKALQKAGIGGEKKGRSNGVKAEVRERGG